MEWLLVAIVVALFVAIPAYGILWKWLFAPLTKAVTGGGRLYQFEEFKWGKAWVYDNDRDRRSQQKPIFFIHGLGGSIYSWRYQLEGLGDRTPVIAIDLLGFGRSAKPLDQPYDLDGHTQRILDILNAKKIDSCYLVGCSLGGALSLWLASQYPDRFSKVMAISPAAIATVAPFPIAAYGSLGGIGQRVISRPIIRMALQNGTVHHHKLTDEIIETYLSPFKEPGAMACFFKTVATIKDIRIYANLKNITVPTLIIRGGGDRVINRRVIQKIAEANSLFSIVEHPVGGHHLMEDEPGWVNGEIQSFFGVN